MKIDDSKIIKFINNDLSRSEKNKIQLLINNNPKIKSRVEGLRNFSSILKELKIEKNEKIKRMSYILNRTGGGYEAQEPGPAAAT